ncbi:RING finger protein 112-like isoform X2 [Ascaphus truei]|uniref:RING finger protein 112-like isoform X2 n=1 Tax=Ascaphus truei TaxID=8439 RepID=UPI003F5AC90F
MAVYVLDTEGTLDIEGDRDTCIKLSALSMMLSSYLILNVSSNLKVTELDYLEMYLHISELIGKSYSLQYLQHLDILVRDWHDFDNCGREAARAYLNNETETMRKTGKYSRVLETFRSPSASCFLMPHPGKRIPQTSQGRLIDMDEDFRSELRTYVSDLVRGVWRYMKTDIHEEKLACAQLGQILKMFFSVENHKCMKNIKKEFQDFMETQAPSTASLFKILAVRPSQMRSRVSGEASRLRQHFEVSLQGTDGRQQLLEELESHLLDAGNKFCADYSKRFTKCAVLIGFAVGGGVLSLAGGVVGAAVAGTVLATEAVALLGSTTAALVTGAVGGSVSMAVVGGGVGAGVGGAIGRREKRREQEAEEASNNQGSAEAEAPLLKHQ